jgi:limonene-1,2-epoxide hydrolase
VTVERYARYWETLRPDAVGELRALATPDLLFRDPFNEIRGVERVIAMLEHMFASLAAPVFVVRRIARDGEVAFIRWDFTCTARGRALAIEGVSEIHLASDGRVAAHLDHWDAASQVYARIPLLGGVLQQLRKRLAAHG